MQFLWFKNQQITYASNAGVSPKKNKKKTWILFYPQTCHTPKSSKGKIISIFDVTLFLGKRLIYKIDQIIASVFLPNPE